MDVVIDQTVIKDIVITGLSCGDDGLTSFLDENFDPIWAIQQFQCDPNLAYLYARLAMIDLAMSFSRNKVDVSKRSGTTRNNAVYDSSNYRDGESNRSSQNTACAWDDATAFRAWQRDREAHDRASSTAYEQSQGNFFNDGTDRSTTRASGSASSTRMADSVSNSVGTMSLVAKMKSFDGGGGGSGEFSPSNVGGSITEPTVSSTATSIEIPLAGVVTKIGPFPGVTAGIVPPLVPNAAAPFSVACFDGGVTVSGLAPGSKGGSWFGEIHVAIPLVGTIRFSGGGGFNQTSNLKYSTGYTDGSSTMRRKLETLGQSFNTDRAGSSDRSTTQKAVHRYGENHRTASGELHAGSSGVDVSGGETHTGSDRQGHAEGQGTGQATSWSKAHSESRGENSSEGRTQSFTRYWSQILDSLQSMQRETMADIKEVEKMLAASAGYVMTKMWQKNPKVRCNPQANAPIRRMADPCIPMNGNCGCGSGNIGPMGNIAGNRW